MKFSDTGSKRSCVIGKHYYGLLNTLCTHSTGNTANTMYLDSLSLYRVDTGLQYNLENLKQREKECAAKCRSLSTQ